MNWRLREIGRYFREITLAMQGSQLPPIFVQARMSSKRLPEKVLMPIGGKPLLRLLLEELCKVWPRDRIAVLTSNEVSDDPILNLCESHDFQVVRGSLNNVYSRFRRAIDLFGATEFFRICGDSPFFPTDLISQFMEAAGKYDGWELITNVAPRTFPKGYSLELVRASTFCKSDYIDGSDAAFEHVTAPFYSCKHRFNMINISTRQVFYHSYAVDTEADYIRLRGIQPEKVDCKMLRAQYVE